MNNIIKLYLLMMVTILNAKNIEQEIGINIGLNSTKNEDGNKFKNPTVRMSYQNNKYIISPRIDVEYTKIKGDYANSLLKMSFNGVYEYENRSVVTPYAVAGVGYEYVSGGEQDVFESHPFVQGGAGVRVDLERGVRVGVEGKILQIISNNDENNEIILTAGVSMPLNGLKAIPKKRIIVRRPQRIVVVRRPQRIVPPPIVVVPPKRRVVVVTSNNNECPIKINAPDLDRDGVSDRLDQCPGTPCNFTIDRYGCPIKTTLKINFASNSAQIRPSSEFQLNKFVEFLLENKGSFVKITGHTDSKGSVRHNLALSDKRANSVVRALIEKGISPVRLQAIGKGESLPLTSNDTASGRAMNRRIEAELTYPKGRK